MADKVNETVSGNWAVKSTSLVRMNGQIFVCLSSALNLWMSRPVYLHATLPNFCTTQSSSAGTVCLLDNCFEVTFSASSNLYLKVN